MLAPTTPILVRTTTGASTITTIQETVADEITSILLIGTMASKGKIDNGTFIPIMEAFLLITTTTTKCSMLISISMMIAKTCLTMMVCTTMVIRR